MNYLKSITDKFKECKNYIITSIDTIYNYTIEGISITSTMLFIMFKKQMDSLLLRTLTNDSIFSAISLISNLLISYDSNNIYINKLLKPFKILLPKIAISYEHKIKLFDRYIYYVIISLTELILKCMSWNEYNWIIHNILLFTTQPLILSKIIIVFDEFYKLIYKQLNKLKVSIITGILSYVLNMICKSVLKIDSNINSIELKYVTKNILNGDKLNDIINFIKILIITIIIKYVGQSKFIYGKFIQILYNYGALIKINDKYNTINKYDNYSNKERLIRIIRNRDWDQLYNARTLNAILDILNSNESGEFMDIIKRNINYCNLQISKFFALYTLSTFLGSLYIPSILSIIIIISENRNDILSYLLRIMSLIMVIISDRYDIIFHNMIYIGISELCELLNNKLVIWLVRTIAEKIYKYRKILIHHNKSNIFIIVCVITIYYYNNLLLLFAFLLLIKHKWIYILMISFGYLSNYNLMHLITIACIIYIFINIMDFKNAPIDNITIPLINSYLIKSELYKSIMRKEPNVIDNYIDKKTIQKDKLKNNIIVIDNYINQF